MFDKETINIINQYISESWYPVFTQYDLARAFAKICAMINMELTKHGEDLFDVIPAYADLLKWSAVENPKVVIVENANNLSKWIRIVGGKGTVDQWADQGVAVIPRTISLLKHYNIIWDKFIDFAINAIHAHWPSTDILTNNGGGTCTKFSIDDPVLTNRKLFYSLAQKHNIKWNFDAVCIDNEQEIVNIDNLDEPAAAPIIPKTVTYDKVYLFTDGACTGNGKAHARASWAYACVGTELIHSDSGLCDKLHSNNRGELTAILKGLEYIVSSGITAKLYVVSDSKYAINCITTWYESWVRKGDTSKKNLDLIGQIYDMDVKCEYIHVHSHIPKPKAHLTHEVFMWTWNDFVDRAAQKLVR